MTFNTLKNADSGGLSSPGGGGGSSHGESNLFTVHQNTIASVRSPRSVRQESMGSWWFGTLERGDCGDCEAWEHSSPLIFVDQFPTSYFEEIHSQSRQRFLVTLCDPLPELFGRIKPLDLAPERAMYV